MNPTLLDTRAQNVFLPVCDMVLIYLLFNKSDRDEVCTQRHPKKKKYKETYSHVATGKNVIDYQSVFPIGK